MDKPDLMSSSAARRPSSGKRILAQLEHGARAPAKPARAAGWTIDGWTIGLFALLLLMCCVAWIMHDKSVTPKTFRPGDSNQTASLAAPGMPQGEQAAAIINEAPPMPAKEAEAAGAAPASSSATPAHVVVAQHKPPQLRTAAPATQTDNTTAVTAAHTGDTDIALLTALVAHTSKPAAVTPERSRDVVERQDGDTTTQLLARCKQLGLIEGMLCRSRICSGRWESDAACRAPAH